MKLKSTLNILGLALAIIVLPIWASSNDVAVTVYNQDIGVVQDMRSLEFEKGVGKLSFRDVPSLIDPTSVGFEIIDDGKEAAILEQNYAYDLVSPDKIYSKYIDQEIELLDKEGNLFTGTLLSYSGGSFVLKEKSGKIKIVASAQVVHANFPELPDGLITRPTLFWLYNSGFTGSADCRVSYQTGGMGWKAEYVGILSEDETNLYWNGWSSITNNSGATFKNATLKLIAGDIHRAGRDRRSSPEVYSLAKTTSAPGFEEKAFFEYHMYTLPRKATLANREIKQISLFDPSTAGVTKEYIFQPDINNKKVKVTLGFDNSAQNGLGMPLPKGRARIFKADSDGSMILLGEDNIDHTPKDEKVKLTIGYAFDISAETKGLDYQRVSNRVEEQTIAIELRNHKKSDVTVKVEKVFNGDWEILNISHEYKKVSANKIEILTPVKANEKSVIKLSVRITR